MTGGAENFKLEIAHNFPNWREENGNNGMQKNQQQHKWLIIIAKKC